MVQTMLKFKKGDLVWSCDLDKMGVILEVLQDYYNIYFYDTNEKHLIYKMQAVPVKEVEK